MGNGYKYGYTGPPFNFLGHMSLTQKQAFFSWIQARQPKLPAIQQFYQIRAAQMRKTAGVLEQFYKAVNDEVLNPTFDKNSWKPSENGHFSYTWREDHLPMISTAQIKAYLQPQLQRQDEGVFAMNHMRNLIEKQEDKANFTNDAQNHPTRSITALITQINGYFAKATYEAVLVNDQTDVYPANSGNPRFRVHQLDAPTTWELELAGRVNAPGDPVNLKEDIQQ